MADRARGATISGANPIPRNARGRSGSGVNRRATDRPVRAGRPILLARAIARDARMKGADGDARDRREDMDGRPVVRIAVRSGSGQTSARVRANKNPLADCAAAGVANPREGDFVDDHIMQVICPTCQI